MDAGDLDDSDDHLEWSGMAASGWNRSFGDGQDVYMGAGYVEPRLLGVDEYDEEPRRRKTHHSGDDHQSYSGQGSQVAKSAGGASIAGGSGAGAGGVTKRDKRQYSNRDPSRNKRDSTRHSSRSDQQEGPSKATRYSLDELTTRLFASQAANAGGDGCQDQTDGVLDEDAISSILSEYWMARSGDVSTLPKALAASSSCHRCGKKVYPVERVDVGIIYHRGCFKCRECGRQLTVASFQTGSGSDESGAILRDVYCEQHVPRQTRANIDAEAMGIRAAVDAQKRHNLKGRRAQLMREEGVRGDGEGGWTQDEDGAGAWEFDPTSSPGYNYAHNVDVKYTLKRRSTLRSHSDFERCGVFAAQSDLENVHRNEEDELYRQMRKEREAHMARLDELLEEESRQTVKDLIEWFEQRGVGQRERDAALSKVTEYFRKHREDQRDALFNRLAKEEQAAAARLVHKHSHEMLTLIRQKERKASYEKSRLNSIRSNRSSTASSGGTLKRENDHNEALAARLETKPRPASEIHQVEVEVDVEEEDEEEDGEEMAPERAPPEFNKDSLFTTPEIFKEQDQHAIEESKREHSTFTDLVRRLSRKCETELQRVRAIFRWITAKDLNRLEIDANVKSDSPLGLLRGIQQGTESYHDLFKRLCSYAGLHCEIIEGFSKGAGYRPGSRLIGNLFRNQWTAVWVEGSWRFINCKWGARHVTGARGRGAKLTYKCDEFYFLTDPEHHIYQHLPDDRVWQLLKKPITEEEFISRPIVKSPFFNAKLTFNGHYGAILDTNDGEIDIAILARRLLPLAAKLRCKNNVVPNEVLRERIMIRTIGNEMIVHANIPCPGTYYLDIYVAKSWSKTTMDNACAFQLRCTGVSTEANMTYPQIGIFGPTPQMSKLGITEDRLIDPYVESHGEILVTLKFSRNLKFTHALKRWDVRDSTLDDFDRYALNRHHNDTRATYVVRCPRRGLYIFSVYASDGDEPSGHEEMQCVLRYFINCRAPVIDASPLPKATRRWKYCRLLEPLYGDLVVCTDARFRLESKLAVDIAVSVEGKWHSLSSSPDHCWQGTIYMGQQAGKAIVYGRFDAKKEKYIPLMEYRIKDKGRFEMNRD